VSLQPRTTPGRSKFFQLYCIAAPVRRRCALHRIVAAAIVLQQKTPLKAARQGHRRAQATAGEEAMRGYLV
jgi:hypothetical protein